MAQPHEWTQYNRNRNRQPRSSTPLPPAQKKQQRPSRRQWAVVTTVAASISLLLCAVVCAFLFTQDNALFNPGVAATISPADNSPTVAPSPTSTPATPAQAIASIVSAILPGATVKLDAGGGDVTITYTYSQPTFGPSQTAQAIERTTFALFQALYTAALPRGLQVADVSITWLGPLEDQFGNVTIGTYGYAELQAATAHRFNWSSLSPGQAWLNYDSAWVRSS